jgi:PKD repeat protein
MRLRTYAGMLVVVLLVLLGLSYSFIEARPAAATQETCPPVPNTPYFTIVYGEVTLDEEPAVVGAIVEARSPRGDVVGCFVITDAGNYGMMYIYGEDTTVTPAIPGMRTGETATFYVDDLPILAIPPLVWADDKTPREITLTDAGAEVFDVDFSGTPRTGDAPLVVQFTSVFTGEVTSYAWAFGDGGLSAEQHPVYTYTTPGAFTVTLAVSGLSGMGSFSRPHYITVTEPTIPPPAPEIDFTATPRSGNAPLAVQFTSIITGEVTSYTWAFGDGGTSVEPHPVYTYTTPGTFAVTLIVSGPGGGDFLSRNNYITVNDPTQPPPVPEVDFTATPRSGDAPLEVHFTSVVTGEVTSYAWAFGDGGTAATAHPTHTYQSAGNFGVTLAITGPGGTVQTVKPDYITISSPPGAPTATFSADVVNGVAPLTVTFTAITSGTVEGWRWDFGDGGTAFTGPVVQHTYGDSSTFVADSIFNVSLTVTNTYGSFTVNKPNYITVIADIVSHSIYLPLVLRQSHSGQ